MWGCFYDKRFQNPFDVVFPTHVGVFLETAGWEKVQYSLPHACGGVSWTLIERIPDDASSPRMWGCF